MAIFGEFQFHHDAMMSPRAGTFFLEVSVSCPVEQLAETDEKSIGNKLLEQATRKEKDFQEIVDLVAGMLGLRISVQFVLEPLEGIILPGPGMCQQEASLVLL